VAKGTNPGVKIPGPNEASVGVRTAIQQIITKIGMLSQPVYSGLTLSGLTASRLIATDASNALTSADLASWVTGTANEISVADDGDGTITIGIVDPLIVGKGGTGLATLTNHGLLLGSGTDAITPLGEATNGQIPIGSTGADPVLATITGTAGQIAVANAAGSITLSLAGGMGDLSGLTPTVGNFIVGDGTNWVTESGDTARISLGVGTTDSPQFTNLDLTGYLELAEIEEPVVPDANNITLFAIDDNGFTTLETLTNLGIRYRINQDTYRIVRNVEDETITRGQLVYVFSGTGNRTNVKLARADSESTMPAIGIVVSDIASDDYGQIMVIGKLLGTGDIPLKTDYAGWEEGYELFVSADTAGGIVVDRPGHPNLPQPVGVIEYSDNNLGRLYIKMGIHLGREVGTNQNNFTIGDQGAGAKTLTFDGTDDGVISWDSGTSILTLPGATTLSGALVIPNDAYIGSMSDPDAIQIETDGDVVLSQSLNITELTASRLIATNASKDLVSADLSSWITGTASQIAIADDGDGTVTLSLTGNMDEIAALTPTDSNIIVGNGTTWVAESGATARTSLGLGTGDSPQFTQLGLGAAAGTTAASIVDRNSISSASFAFSIDSRPTLASSGKNVYGIYFAPTATIPANKWYVGFTTAPSITVLGGENTSACIGYYAGAATLVSGTLDTTYGVYINALNVAAGAAKSWGVYQAYVSDKNYFAGNTAFGVATPLEDVHAGDTVRADVAFNLNGTDGITTTFLDQDGNTISVVGGIITAKTAP
jgi:hypothetical protein